MSAIDSRLDSETLQGHYAGFVTRFIAFLIDLLIISIIFSGAAISLEAIGSFFERDISALIRETSVLSTLVTALVSLFPVVYFTVFWAAVGQTPGKTLMGLRIYTVDGKKLNLRRAFIRYISYWLSTGLLFAGFFLVLIDKRRQTLHDKIARTIVVYDWDARIHSSFTKGNKTHRPPRQ